MATVRIQVRRGTASQWTSANPTLAAGEMGVESDTNLFKFGNGSTAWASLAYANNSDVAIAEISQDAINNALSVGSGLTKTYDDGANTIVIAVSDAYFTELAQDAVNTAFIAGDGIKKAYSDASNTITVDVDLATSSGLKLQAGQLSVDEDRTVTKTGSQTLTNKQLNSPGINDANPVTVTGTEINYLTGLTKNISNSYSEILNGANDYTDSAIGTLQSTVTTGYVPVSIVGQADGIATLNNIGKLPMSQLNLIDAELNGDTTVENLEISGSLVFNGTATQINSTNLSVTDPLIYLGEANPANSVDLGIVSSFTAGGTYQHTGLVRDHAANGWVLFKGVTDEPTTTINFSQGTPDDLTVGGLHANTLTVGNVTNTEFGYLDGVGSPIQTQLDAKAPKESPTFTGTITLPSGTINTAALHDTSVTTDKIADAAVTSAKIATNAISQSHLNDDSVGTNEIGSLAVTTAKIADSAVTSAKIANDTIVNADINGSAAISWTKLAISSSVSATAAGYLSGVTSGIQSQIDSKFAIAGGELTGDLTLRGNPTTNNMAATKNYVDSLNNAEVTNRNSAIADEATARNTAITTAVSTHAALTASHGVTGAVVGTENTQTLTNKTLTSPVINTPTGITKSDVGLANVNNTADSAKPVSTAQQTALDAKLASVTAASTYAPLASPALTGSPTAPTATAADNSTKIATTAYADRAASNAAAALVASAPSALDTLNELATALGNDASFSTTVTNSLATKSPIASPTFTGTVTAPAITATGLITASASGVAFTDGTQTKAGVPSLTIIGTTISAAYNLSTGGLALRDQLIPVSGAYTITVPSNATTAFPIGASISFYQSAGADGVFAEAAGVTILKTPGLKLRALYSSATLTKVATDTWLLAGDLKA